MIRLGEILIEKKKKKKIVVIVVSHFKTNPKLKVPFHSLIQIMKDSAILC
jgi:hypothetical protein